MKEVDQSQLIREAQQLSVALASKEARVGIWTEDVERALQLIDVVFADQRQLALISGQHLSRLTLARETLESVLLAEWDGRESINRMLSRGEILSVIPPELGSLLWTLRISHLIAETEINKE